jgi:hypothetical protein
VSLTGPADDVASAGPAVSVPHAAVWTGGAQGRACSVRRVVLRWQQRAGRGSRSAAAPCAAPVTRGGVAALPPKPVAAASLSEGVRGTGLCFLTVGAIKAYTRHMTNRCSATSLIIPTTRGHDPGCVRPYCPDGFLFALAQLLQAFPSDAFKRIRIGDPVRLCKRRRKVLVEAEDDVRGLEHCP